MMGFRNLIPWFKFVHNLMDPTASSHARERKEHGMNERLAEIEADPNREMRLRTANVYHIKSMTLGGIRQLTGWTNVGSTLLGEALIDSTGTHCVWFFGMDGREFGDKQIVLGFFELKDGDAGNLPDLLRATKQSRRAA
jgi:hypothetical protein